MTDTIQQEWQRRLMDRVAQVEGGGSVNRVDSVMDPQCGVILEATAGSYEQSRELTDAVRDVASSVRGVEVTISMTATFPEDGDFDDE